ncbi:hypothetical protein SBA3_1120016 [Candidatus Sulfopaludibacter sp. SbA3]|nr:hypothetical protein SBA3_1120016 [Candidatus Sulfopaludibacter sp. SbA3]
MARLDGMCRRAEGKPTEQRSLMPYSARACSGPSNVLADGWHVTDNKTRKDLYVALLVARPLIRSWPPA